VLYLHTNIALPSPRPSPSSFKYKKLLDEHQYSQDAKEMLRISPIRLVVAGESPEEVAKDLGLDRRQIYRWLSMYAVGGEEALKSRPIKGAPGS
jgi:hypothetical protein